MENSLQNEEIEALESIYGNEWKKEIDSDSSYSIDINHDVKLFINLHPLYPSEAPPTYQLLAPSLTKSKKQLITQTFEDIYLENIGGAVLFQSIEKLKEIVLDENVDEIIPDKCENETEAKVKIEPLIYRDFNILTGPKITDRKSTFQGHVCLVNSEEDVRHALSYLIQNNKKVAQATHNILAYKIELDGGVLIKDCDDDGETHAGGRLLHMLLLLKLPNIMVVVSRWYGGIHLGPDRFRHINNAARLALEQAGYIK